MTDARKPSGTKRDKLVANLRAGHKSARQRSTAPAASPSTPAASAHKPGAFDFSELAPVRQLRMHRAAADMIGLDNPFFQPHEGVAGATSVLHGTEHDNFSSYNYLGLTGDPRVNAAAEAAIRTYGTSASASRVVAGERPVHGALEAALARLHGVEDAVVMVSGHATNVTTIGHLLGEGDLVLTDALVHNSISEGARLSGAARKNFPHDDLDALEKLLIDNRHRYENVLIAVEGIYSMDGDFPDLPRLIRLKQEFGAWLLVDEAHSFGVLGKTGKGIAEHFGIDPNTVEMWMGTLSKTLSACGGYIAGSKALCDYLRATAPGFVFSVGLAPPLAAAALASAEILEQEPERVARLAANGQRFLTRARAAGLDTGNSAGYSVIPVIVGDSIGAATLSNRLLKRRINALPIVFPAVAEKSARLRFFITSEHSDAQIDRAVAATAEELALLREQNVGFGSLVKSARD
ncbi:aminotransferase class I/II-fold pyridoxal phosphate-dependent enzyme [Stappia taiwanensis]|uniref:Aminotransferase class I/II-fold pyridoxal phosphate-dependent enzyme n=1 Tax=Stappia taiwanensis TaxID=992267 RepID=A0A838XT18_9HYPH|nr:aminotransferase class I/II-fold pyridoxal phosphate-dependent enzyme [Stappia taiwanensis]MBA4610050.1 aminotransferase class I/II-fold pyridoxal phosphate-dependent enzyme [Stappia taiwanensis]GGE76544.1 polyketide synthase [Stappia taiwanensis]